MDYELIRSGRRSLALQMKPDGTLVVRAPRLLSRRRIEVFLREHEDWIRERRQKLADAPRVEKLSLQELEALKERARRLIPDRVARFAPMVGVSVGRVSIRSQHSRWGSCSSKGNLNFNCLLLLAPEYALDYVVVHELCHRLEMNHSPRFWALVEHVLPDYARGRAWLKKNGGSLLARLPE